MKTLRTIGLILGSSIFFLFSCICIFFACKYLLPKIFAWDAENYQPPPPYFQVIGYNQLLDQYDVLDTGQLRGPKGFLLNFILPDSEGEIDLGKKHNFRYFLSYSVSSNEEYDYIVTVEWTRDDLQGNSVYAVNQGNVVLLHNEFFHPGMLIISALIAFVVSLVSYFIGKLIRWLTRKKEIPDEVISEKS